MTTLNPGGAEQAEAVGIPVIRGDALHPHVLAEAGIADARIVVIAEDTSEHITRTAAVVRARTTAPIVARPHDTPDLAELAEAGVNHVVDTAQATRWRLVQAVLDRLGIPRPAIPPPGTTDRPGQTPARSSTTGGRRAPAARTPPRSGRCSPIPPPASTACAPGMQWVHLRTCLSCGNVGCCDSSPGRYARAHHHDTDHPIAASAEPGETWAYCFFDDITAPAPEPAEHRSAEPRRQETP